MAFFTENNIWELKSSNIRIQSRVFSAGNDLPTFYVDFTIQRRPAFVVMNVILPVVFLAALNILVFLMPTHEQLGFSMTCLLALAVFLSITSTLLPQSTLRLPRITVYLLDQLISSTLVVVTTIVIVRRSNQEEGRGTEERNSHSPQPPAAKQSSQNCVTPIAVSEDNTANTRVKLYDKDNPTAPPAPTQGQEQLSFRDILTAHVQSAYNYTLNNTNRVAFIAFSFHWFIATFMFFILITT